MSNSHTSQHIPLHMQNNLLISYQIYISQHEFLIFVIQGNHLYEVKNKAILATCEISKTILNGWYKDLLNFLLILIIILFAP